MRLFLLTLCGSLSGLSQDPGRFRIEPLIGKGSPDSVVEPRSFALDGPTGLAVDPAGAVYVSERFAGRIWRVQPGGLAERFAGTGVIGDAKAGTAAIDSDLRQPGVMAIAPDGTLVFADTGACRIRRVDRAGVLRDVIGTGRCPAAAGSGGLPFGPPGGFPGAGGGATLQARPALEVDVGEVGGLAFDGQGQLLYTDTAAHVIRRLESDGFVRVIGGAGAAAYAGDTGKAEDAYFHSPRGIAFDANGHLYVADSGNCRVRRVSKDGYVDTIAGAACPSNGASASEITLTRLSGIAVREALYVASAGTGRVLRVDLDTYEVTVAAGNGRLFPYEPARTGGYVFDEIAALALSDIGLLIADQSSFRVLALRNGEISEFAGRWPHAAFPEDPAEASLMRPRGLCAQPGGGLLVADAGVERVLTLRGGIVSPVAGGQFPAGHSGGDGGQALDAQLSKPKRILCAPDGRIFISHEDRIRVVETSGLIRNLIPFLQAGSVSQAPNDPVGLALDAAGNLLIAEAGAHRVVRYNFTTRSAVVIAGTGSPGFGGDGGAATSAPLESPGDIALDAAGNLYIADRGNRRVRRVTPSGRIDTVAGSSRGFSFADITGLRATSVGLGSVDGLALDAAGNLFIAEYPRVSMVRPDGRIYVLAGYLGEDDSGTKSYASGPLNGCDGLLPDESGRVFVSLRHAARVVALAPAN